MPHNDEPRPEEDGLRSDEPIETKDGDLLDRDTLVAAIASQISATKGSESITIGLNAPWGAGKSSFLNLLEKELAPESGQIIVRFNPWLYGNIDQLVLMFFHAIADGVGADSEAKRALRTLLITFASHVANATVQHFAPNVFGFLPSSEPKLSTGVKTLERTKDKVNDALQVWQDKTQGRIVVFIDDIDRLERDVTRLLFRMVRLNGNLKYMTYVLAFDRSVVEKHLTHDTDTPGGEYLDKIIQVSYDIPLPNLQKVGWILKDELANIRRSFAANSDRNPLPLDERRYSQLFREGFVAHFTTLRIVNRYVNALRLRLGPVVSDVSLVDFYIIELLRLLYPDVYERIYRTKALLAIEPRSSEAPRDTKTRLALDKERVKWIRELFSDSSVEDRLQNAVLKLLVSLFPNLIAASSVDSATPEEDWDSAIRNAWERVSWEDAERSRWARERRACSALAFDNYFLLSEPGDQLTDRDAMALGAAIGNVSALGVAIGRARRLGKISDLLKQLEGLARNLRGDQAIALARDICGFDRRDDLLLDDTHREYRKLSRVVQACMVWCDSADERRAVLRETVENGDCVFTVANVFEDVFTREFRESVGPAGTQALQAAMRQRILEALERESTFWRGTRWYYLLYLLSKVGGKEVVLEKIGEQGDNRLVWLADTFRDAAVDEEKRGRKRVNDNDRPTEIGSWLTTDARKRLEELGRTQLGWKDV